MKTSANKKASKVLAVPPRNKGTLIKRRVVRPLKEVEDWEREVGKIYREMRRGAIPHDEGTKLTWVANTGAKLAAMRRELKELEQLREQLAQLRAPGSVDLLIEDTDIADEQINKPAVFHDDIDLSAATPTRIEDEQS